MIDFGILGNNARNLNYIKKFNPKKESRLADNKIKTKVFLQERGIPVPETYGIIKNRNDLYKFDFSKLSKDDFVVKPNKGSKGKGIYVVKRYIGDSDYVKKYYGLNDNKRKYFNYFFGNTKNIENYYFKIAGELFSQSDYLRILTDIVDGKYSMTAGNDKILVEEKILPGEGFLRYCNYGLADIRIIVFNLVPVAAMVRVPTQWSGGKANIAQGGVGLGLELGSGKVKSMFYKGRIFKTQFPGDFRELYQKKIPYWNDVLLFSTRVQYFVNIGYLALDWVITNNGPKILEINSRAGLEVQNACIVPLKKRLQKIGDIKISDPEKGVEISKSLFSKSKSNVINTNKILYLSQFGRLIIEKKNNDLAYDIMVRVDLRSSENKISRYLNAVVQENLNNDILVDIPDNEIRFKNLKFNVSDNLEKNEIVICRDVISEYYIRPLNKVHSEINVINPSRIIEEEKEVLHMIDQKIASISAKLNLSNILKPVNYFDELDNFIIWRGNYNPKFIYARPEENLLKEIENQTDELKNKYYSKEFGVKSDFGKIFIDKINELLIRINLIRAYKGNKHSDILKNNILLYGDFDQDILIQSKEKILSSNFSNEQLMGKILSLNQVKKYIKNYLDSKGIYGVKILIDSSTVSRISVTKGKNVTIKISNTMDFRENELESIMAHEIDVHLMRYINGKKTGWYILKSGSGYYIKTEEGLALYKSYQVLSDGEEKNGAYLTYYLLNQASNCDFSRTASIYRSIRGGTLITSFKKALRTKRGIQNTGFVDKGSVFMKDKVYLEGYKEVKKWIENGGSIDKLMVGKVKLSDLDFIY